MSGKKIIRVVEWENKKWSVGARKRFASGRKLQERFNGSHGRPALSCCVRRLYAALAQMSIIFAIRRYPHSLARQPAENRPPASQNAIISSLYNPIIAAQLGFPEA